LQQLKERRVTLNNEDQEAYAPLSLAYNAPQFNENPAQLIPYISYNAFPDINEKGKDKLYPEPPSRAKYLWPLACIFNPYETFSGTDQGIKIRVESEAQVLHKLSHIFEMVHARLAFTETKRLMRNLALTPFYTQLRLAINSEDMIEVPLLRDPAGSTLQFMWCVLSEMFKNLIHDEVYSMLATVAFIGTSLEKRWVAEEERHIQGLADAYWKTRKVTESMFGKLEACNTETERLTWATKVIAHGQLGYSVVVPKSQAVPRFLLVKEGVFESFQSVLGNYLFDQERKRNIVATVDTAIICGIDTVCSTAETYIMVSPSNEVIDEIIDHAIRDQLTGRQVGFQIIFATIFLESIRQQICHGVGLRCPFWTGECCGIIDVNEVLKNLYNITKLWNPAWKHHWQIPPCLQ
jgi:hypothetical protein